MADENRRFPPPPPPRPNFTQGVPNQTNINNIPQEPQPQVVQPHVEQPEFVEQTVNAEQAIINDNTQQVSTSSSAEVKKKKQTLDQRTKMLLYIVGASVSFIFAVVCLILLFIL